MSDQLPDFTSIRHIRDARDVGSIGEGQVVTLNLRMEDHSSEWFAIKHSNIGRLVTAMMFGASVAANDRATVAGHSTQSADQAALVDIARINASSAPGAGYVALRVVVGEGVNVDFRLPLAVVPALQEKLSQAAAMAQSALPKV